MHEPAQGHIAGTDGSGIPSSVSFHGLYDATFLIQGFMNWKDMLLSH